MSRGSVTYPLVIRRTNPDGRRAPARSEERDRTSDHSINSRALCQLSYFGSAPMDTTTDSRRSARTGAGRSPTRLVGGVPTRPPRFRCEEASVYGIEMRASRSDGLQLQMSSASPLVRRYTHVAGFLEKLRWGRPQLEDIFTCQSRTKSAMTAGALVSKPATSSMPPSSGSAIENRVAVIPTTMSLAGMPIASRYFCRAWKGC